MFFVHDATVFSGPRLPDYWGFTITLRHTALGRNPLDEWSARRRQLYLTTQNTHKRQTSIQPAGFESAAPASERPQTHTLDRAATEIDRYVVRASWNFLNIILLNHQWLRLVTALRVQNVLPVFIVTHRPLCGAPPVAFPLLWSPY
jgi:hypothetical protein